MVCVVSLSFITAPQGQALPSSSGHTASPNDDGCPPIIIIWNVKKIYTSRRKVNRLTAPVHSKSDLQRYLSRTHESGSPLDALAPNARKRFVESLKFTDLGLASFNYSDLEALTATQVYRILGLFGVQQDTPMTDARIETPADQAIMNMPLQPSGICFPGGGGGGGGGGGHQGYRCLSKGTCIKATDFICTSNC